MFGHRHTIWFSVFVCTEQCTVRFLQGVHRVWTHMWVSIEFGHICGCPQTLDTGKEIGMDIKHFLSSFVFK